MQNGCRDCHSTHDSPLNLDPTFAQLIGFDVSPQAERRLLTTVGRLSAGLHIPSTTIYMHPSHGCFHGPLVCPNRKRTVPPQQRDGPTTKMRCAVVVMKPYGSPWSLECTRLSERYFSRAMTSACKNGGRNWVGYAARSERRRAAHLLRSHTVEKRTLYI